MKHNDTFPEQTGENVVWSLASSLESYIGQKKSLCYTANLSSQFVQWQWEQGWLTVFSTDQSAILDSGQPAGENSFWL